MKQLKIGFTFIELIIVISIILLFSGLLLPQYGLMIEQFRLKTEITKLSNIFELARKKTISRDIAIGCNGGFNGYEVYLKSNGYDFSLCCGGECTRNTPLQSVNLNSQTSIVQGTGYLQFIPSTPGTGFIQFRTSLIQDPPFLHTDTIIVKNNSIPLLNKCIQISVSSVGIVNISNTFTNCP